MAYGGYTGGGYVQTASETPPPPVAPHATAVVAPRPRPADWAFVVATASGEAIADLTSARSRNVKVRLRDSGEAGFSLPGTHPQSAEVAELSTDLLVYRDRELLFRGRIGASSDRLSADVHTATFSAHDYREMLRRRILYTDLTFTQADEEAIGWDLISHTQAQTGGNLGIRREGWATGKPRDRTYPAGKNVGEALDQLTEVLGGPDVEIGPDLVYRAWPQRGRHLGVVLAYGENVIDVDRDVNPSDFANAVRVTGKGTEDEVVHTTPEVRESPGLSITAEGRFDLADGDTDIVTQSAVAARADGLIAERSIVRPGYTVTLAPGFWQGPEHLWLGDAVTLQIRSGRLEIDTHLRVYEVDMSPGDDGGEKVMIRLGRPRTRPTLVDQQQLRQITSALTDLNRR